MKIQSYSTLLFIMLLIWQITYDLQRLENIKIFTGVFNQLSNYMTISFKIATGNVFHRQYDRNFIWDQLQIWMQSLRIFLWTLSMNLQNLIWSCSHDKLKYISTELLSALNLDVKGWIYPISRNHTTK